MVLEGTRMAAPFLEVDASGLGACGWAPMRRPVGGRVADQDLGSAASPYA
jgi:hypothetical protein